MFCMEEGHGGPPPYKIHGRNPRCRRPQRHRRGPASAPLAACTPARSAQSCPPNEEVRRGGQRLRRAILGNIRLLILGICGAGRGPPYTKHEGPNHAPSGVSGCARPLHSADKFVHLPRAFMPPGVRWRGRTGAAGGGGSGDFSHVFCMTEARLGPPPYKTYETPTM